MTTRAIVGKVDRQGNGRAIYLGHGGYPDQAGARLLQHYSDERTIHQLIGLGSVAWLETTPEETITYFCHRRQLWMNCQPYAFGGGTERFFADYWSPSPEWLYVWTPDGWLGNAAMPGAPPQSYYQGSPESYNPDPQWREWLRKTREF